MSDLTHPRLLIADDREENRYVLGRVLRGAGYECAEAGTGARALEIAETLPDLIILDVRLPDMSGYDVCQRVKANPRTATIPVLQISASFVAPEDRVRALDAGADGYLTHPIDRMVLVATVRALLRLRAAELNARRAAEQWESTFNALTEGLAILDVQNRLVRWNGAFSAICGRGFEAEMGKDPSGFLCRLTGMERIPDPKGAERFTTEFANGSRTIQLSVNSMVSQTGSNEKILILSDITDRKLAEYAVRTAEKLAATGKLANAMAHEINNPLEALTNLIYLSRSSSDADFVQELLARASDELDRIGRITKQTLAFHRDTQRPTPVDLGQLLSEVLALYESSSSAKRVRLVFDARPTQPIHGFPGQLSQVFGNLVRNATEAAPPNSDVIVRVRTIHRHGRPGTRITIHDRGVGIPQVVREKMFDPFFTTKDLKGSGLGLWVSKGLIAKHNGVIRFRSSDREGRNGTTFEVFLPADVPISQMLH